MQEEIAERIRQAAQGDVGADTGVRGEGGGERGVVGFHLRRAFAPGDDRAFVEGFVGVEDEVRIEIGFGAETVARGAGAEVAVEREVLRRESRKGEAGAGVGEGGGERVIGKVLFSGRLHGGDEVTFAPAEGGFHGIGETLAQSGFEDETIDDGFDAVFAFFIQLDALFGVEVGDGAVDAGADETFAAEFFDDVAELAFLILDDGGEEDEFAFGREGEDGVGDFLGGQAADDFAGFGIVRGADGGVEDAQVIVDFGGGGDGRARTGGGGALLDGDGWGEAFDKVHVGAFEAVEKLAGVGGEAFDVFALAFGIEGVEGEGRFAGAAGAGEDDESVTRDDDVDVFEVVLARAFDADARGFAG